MEKKAKIRNKIESFDLIARGWGYDYMERKDRIGQYRHFGKSWTFWTKLDILDKIVQFGIIGQYGQNWTFWT